MAAPPAPPPAINVNVDREQTKIPKISVFRLICYSPKRVPIHVNNPNEDPRTSCYRTFLLQESHTCLTPTFDKI